MMRFKSFLLVISVILTLTSLAGFSASASDKKEFTVVIKNHQFEPSSLTVPAGEKFRLIVDNQDPTPEEFESHALSREKIIQGNSKGIILLGPLKAGSYEYFGEFNEDTAKGIIVAE
jgi:plastocyanin